MFKLFTSFRLEDDFNVLKQYNDKSITLFNDYIPKSIDDLKHNPHNFIIIHEPNEFFGFHDWVIQNSNLFSLILTWNENILNNCSNSYLFTCNYQQDSIEYYNTFKNKNKIFEVSFLSGIKTISNGHKLRNRIYTLKNQINIPKKWFHTLEDFDHNTGVRPGYGDYTKDLSHIPLYLKSSPQVYGKRICFDNAMFHVCVENVKYNNWYTEKIGEAFCTKTVPIYWGCPNIGEYYDERGIITFETEEELIHIIDNLTPEKYYEMKSYIDYNYEVALLDSFSNKLDNIFKEVIKINNI
jgi:hypothetical protein